VKSGHTFGAISVAAAAAAGLAAMWLLPGAGAARASAAIPGIVDIDTLLGDQNAAAAGTGIVLTSSGEILTNNHVIRASTRVKVTDLDNGRTYTGKVVGYSVANDVAVVQLQNASGLKVAPIGDSSTARVGAAVNTYGNAQGAGGAPGATGKIVALGRSVTVGGDGTYERLTGMIETNAPLQPGDSGGPMVDAAGKVIGMDTAAGENFSFDSSFTRGFAIPIDSATSLAARIVAGRTSSTIHVGPTAFLGVIPASQGHSYFESGSTLMLQAVVPGSPSDRAGLGAFDTITGFNGKPIRTLTTLTSLLLTKVPGDTVRITWVDQYGAQHTSKVTLASGPPQ
jgi:S1-C subfamily serine protease